MRLTCPHCGESPSRGLETIRDDTGTQGRSGGPQHSPVQQLKARAVPPESHVATKNTGHSFGRVGTIKCTICREAGKKVSLDF
jgi:hypothetical protein